MATTATATTTVAPPPPRRELYEVEPNGDLVFNFHAGQLRAWESDRRFVTVLAGTQSGKTAFIPWWLAREVESGGPGDYLAVTASYDLFKLKMLPSLREVFEHVLGIGRYWSGDRIIELADPETGRFRAQRADDPMWGRIILRSAESGGGLESTTARAAALDEAGMDSFTAESWQAILRRLSLSLGRVLVATTLYNFGWLKSEVYDRWAAGDRDFEVVQFESAENPAFPLEEYERARRSMPLWRFNMQYRGVYTRPAGLIYGVFDEAEHVVPPFAVPAHWPRHLGLDFGAVNTAGVFLAAEPGTGTYYLYREYRAGGRTAREHTRELMRAEVAIPTCVGGSHSEGQWRSEFAATGTLDGEKVPGLPVREPDIRDVELGINRVHGLIAAGKLRVFNTCTGWLDEVRSYSRKLDRSGQPTDAIEAKETYHFMDATRYVVGWLRRTAPTLSVGRSPTAGYRGG